MGQLQTIPEVELRRVLAAYPLRELGSAAVRPVRGGLSGAVVLQLDTLDGRFCLRRWPREHPSPERLSYVHEVLQRVQRARPGLVPAPIFTTTGRSWFTSNDGFLWELTPWLAGETSWLQDRHAEKLASALRLLAEFHHAANHRAEAGLLQRKQQVSPSLVDRHAQLTELVSGGRVQLAQNIDRSTVYEIATDEIRGLALDLLRLFDRAAPRVLHLLAHGRTVPLAIGACIRDVKQDHILFQGQTATGIVDFGAMRDDSAVLDITRLLGSMAEDDPAAWRAGLAAYEAVRPLSDAERSVIAAADQSSVLLSCMNWLRWIYVDRRTFGDWAVVARRLDELRKRLQVLAERNR